MSQHGVPPEEIWPNDVLARGTQLHGYRITSILGRGGFGVTYLGEDLLGQVFAIKEYFPRQFAVRQGAQVHAASGDDAALFAECRERFVYEARALVSLGRAGGAHDDRARASHDDIVKVQTFFEANGTAYMVMEYVLGRSMQAVLRDHPQGMPEAELAPLLVNLLAGLATVHKAGLMHRDIKPGNILIREDGRPVLIDFGSSRDAGSLQTHGFTQIFSGGYAPPEQILGTRQGVFSDIYAVGVVGYEAIGGKAVDALARQQAQAAGMPDPMLPASQVGAGRYGVSLLAAIDAALALDPAARPVSAEAMAWRIQAAPEPVGGWPGDDTVVAPRALKEHRPAAAAPAPALARPATRGRMALAGGATAVVVGLAAAGWLFLVPPAPPPAPVPRTAGLATPPPAIPARPPPAQPAEAPAPASSAASSPAPTPPPPASVIPVPRALPTPVAEPAPLSAVPTPPAPPTPEPAVPTVTATPAPRATEEAAPPPAGAETLPQPPTRLALAPPPASPPPSAEPPAAAPTTPAPATPTPQAPAPVPSLPVPSPLVPPALPPIVAEPPKPLMPPFGITEARGRAQELACALLGVGEAPGASVKVWGAALPGAALDGLLDLLRRELGAVDSDIEPLEPGHCAAASTLAGMVRAAGERGGGPMRLTGPDAPVPAGSRFAAKGPRAPGRALYVDLYGADGVVRHLLRQTEARGTGEGDIRFETTASGPPGRYLLVAVAVTEPLELGQHPASEAVSAYLPALQRAVARLPAGAPRMAVGMLSLVAPVPTVPPPSRPAAATTPSRAPSLNAARCADIVARVQLGEALSDADRTALRTSCRP